MANHSRPVRPRALTSVEIAKIVSGAITACIMAGIPSADLRRVVAGLRELVKNPGARDDSEEGFGDWVVPIAGIVGALTQWNDKQAIVAALSGMDAEWDEIFDPEVVRPPPAAPIARRSN